jgi:hypothetical protein
MLKFDYGGRNFILCLGYRGDAIKRFFLEYNEAIASDFTMNSGGSGPDRVMVLRSLE